MHQLIYFTSPVTVMIYPVETKNCMKTCYSMYVIVHLHAYYYNMHSFIFNINRPSATD